MAHPKHEQVRRRYAFCCGYCGVTEESTGGQLTVDHYQPVSAGGDDSDDNLVYACWRCNLYKSDNVPVLANRTVGQRLLHPLRDDINAHILENEITGHLEPRTETGRFHIAVLHLNRPELVTHRQRRSMRALSDAMLQTNIEEIRRLRLLVAEHEARLLITEHAENIATDRNTPDGED